MGLLEKIFGGKKPQDKTAVGWKTFTELNPVFTAFDGSIYEQELTRAAIERFALACCKLKPEVVGPSTRPIVRNFPLMPNESMTWPAFLARCATIHECKTTLYIVPSFASDMKTITGIYPFLCEYAEVVEYAGEPWIRMHTATGDVFVIELKYVGIVTKFQYESEFFGSGNNIDSTMSLIHAQGEAQENAIKNGSKIRFIGSLTGQVREEDMKKKRERFVKDNFTSENTGGLMLYDQTFSSIEQIAPHSYTIDSAEMQRIDDNVYTYFGINKDILQNSYTEEVWGAWYEGRIEPFAIKLGEAITKILFSKREQQMGNRVTFSSNRLEYASNASKRNMVRDMVDRGIMTLNEAREVLQLPPLEGGDVRVIRGEYIMADAISTVLPSQRKGGGRPPMNVNDGDRDLGGDDDIYNDSDHHGEDDDQ